MLRQIRPPLDLAVLLVARPCWGRKNVFDQPPRSAVHMPFTEAILAFGYLSRMMMKIFVRHGCPVPADSHRSAPLV